MPVVFFDGFNFGDGESITLNPAYWSSNNGYGFEGARTGNGVRLPNRAQNSALTSNSWLKLSNFSNPLTGNSCIGIGFWVNGAGIRTGHSGYTETTYENLLSLTTNNGTLSIDFARPADNVGVAIVVRENGAVMGAYDFRSVVGNSWYHSNVSADGGVVGYVDGDKYFDFFFDAANGAFSVRAAGGNTLSSPLYNASNSASTAITSFSSVTEVQFYGQQPFNFWNSTRRVFDDFYFTAGNALADVFLGPNTRIYRLTGEQTLANNWQRSDGNDFVYQLAYNNGDSNYAKSATTGDISTMTINNLPGGAPGYVNGVKLFNVVRKAGLDNQSLVNVIAADSGATPQEVGPTYAINSETYSLKESTFLTNPLTASVWTPTDINNLVIGVKNVT